MYQQVATSETLNRDKKRVRAVGGWLGGRCVLLASIIAEILRRVRYLQFHKFLVSVKMTEADKFVRR